MDVLLDQPRGNHVCGSIQDIQDQLHHSLVSKSSDTRAEHASLTFELRHNTIFHLSPDLEHNLSDNLVDPGNVAQQQSNTRPVNAFETVQNQPPDDPVLQRAVAKHIVSALGIIDSSSWTVRKVSRDAQGWTFTYICKDSLLAWNRANSKTADKPAIGSYSGPGSLDPTNASRPAFDCRGTLTIAFSKSARGVIVKYNHTPIHKTVAQLMELLVPTLPPAPVNGNKTSQRTSKVKRPPPSEGEEGSRKKRQRKKGKAPEAPMGGLSLEGGQHASNTAESQGADPNSTPMTAIVNVHPEEAERRKRTALDLLNGRGIDPATLSDEQFNIFSNQAPDLQATSLEMLANYGAERLRIVHPNNGDQSSSANSTPAEGQPVNETPATAPGPASAPGTNETPTKQRRSRKKKSDGPVAEVSIGDGAVVSVERSGEVGTTTSTLKPSVRRTRGSCRTCRERRTKCTKQHPSCAVCIEAGIECVYLPPKPRRKKSGVSAKVVQNEDSDVPGEREQFEELSQAQETAPTSPAPGPPDPPSPQVQSLLQHPAPHVVPQPPVPDNDEFIPDPNILSGPTEHQPTTQSLPAQYYHDSHAGLTFPQDAHTTMSTMTFPESQARGTQPEPSPNLPFSPTSHHDEHSSGLAFTQSISKMDHKKQSTSTPSRRSLPTSHSRQTPIPVPATVPTPVPTPVPAPVIPQHAPNWNASHTTGHAAATSPALAKQQAPNRSRSHQSVTEANQQTHDGMKQAMALSQAAVQQHSRTPSVSGSPYQTAAQPNSRQSHRSRTNTPVGFTSRPPPQAPQAAVNTPYNTTPSASIPNYDSYSRYESSTNRQYDNANNDQSSSRITYKPGSYHPNTVATTSTPLSSAPAYDYTQTTTSSNPLSQAFNPSVGYSAHSAAATQWPTSQTRGSQQHAQAHTNNAHPMTSTTNSTAAHSYGTRSNESRSQHQNASYNPSQSQPYGSYSTQQANTNQQTQQNWYDFANANGSRANPSSYNSSRGGNYGGSGSSTQPSYTGHRPNAPGYSGHSYGSGSDDQALYDMLRASGSTH